MSDNPTDLYIRNVPSENKARLKEISRLAGFQGMSEFMRTIVDEVCAQGNIDFLIDGDIKNKLIEIIGLLNRLVETQNTNTEHLVTVELLLKTLLGNEYHGEEVEEDE